MLRSSVSLHETELESMDAYDEPIVGGKNNAHGGLSSREEVGTIHDYEVCDDMT